MDAADSNTSNQRSFVRMKINTLLSFNVPGQSEIFEGKCKNLSGAGMLIETEKKIPIGTKLNVTVPSEHADSHTLNAVVEVKRLKHLADIHRYELGVVITQIKS